MKNESIGTTILYVLKIVVITTFRIFVSISAHILKTVGSILSSVGEELFKLLK